MLYITTFDAETKQADGPSRPVDLTFEQASCMFPGEPTQKYRKMWVFDLGDGKRAALSHIRLSC